ncbi:MAG: pteridine reductase [Chromatiaceae bacterium]|nr:pteridine reductase [Chromatiaceae bacterium]
MAQKPNPQPLVDKVALITGAAHRIGAEIARLLHAQGADLVIHYRNSLTAAEALRRELEASRPASVLLMGADLHDCQAFPALMTRVQDFRGRLDILVNNASSFYPTPFAEVDENQWDDLMASNLKGPFFLAQAAAPLLRASRGCIINLVDIHAERPHKNHSVYSIAKAGNAMMVKALARELGPEIRVNGIAPGIILWPEGESPSQAARAEVLSRTALGRPGSPADIAGAVSFLAREADYITGQIIAVDGGRTLQQ